MRIACLQFAPALGKVTQNIEKADSILKRVAPCNVDLLVLPEMIFTGYNFRSLAAISQYLEPTTSGPSTRWAQETARRLKCHVTVGYPEITLTRPFQRFNSAVTVAPDGVILCNYRKHFLYETDESWADEGPGGFFAGELGSLGNVAMGICMDINPYRFIRPWAAYEFANHALTSSSPLIVLSMAWTTQLTSLQLSEKSTVPDMDTLSYWLARFQPLINWKNDGNATSVTKDDAENEIKPTARVNAQKTEGNVFARLGSCEPQEPSNEPQEVIIVFCNRCGLDEDIRFAGTTTVVGIKNGTVRIFDLLGRAEEGCLMVDTEESAKYAVTQQ